MKKIILIAALLVAATLGRATVTINFTVGILNDAATGANPLADGSLVQIIGSADGAFASPTAGSFIGGDDVLLFSNAFNSAGTTGTAGAMTIVLSDITLASGTNLLLRWFPTLTSASVTPGASTIYGEYGKLSDVLWVSPSNGANVNIDMLTVDAGGSVPNSAGHASLATAAIPEPSTYAALFGGLALGLAAYRRRQQTA